MSCYICPTFLSNSVVGSSHCVDWTPLWTAGASATRKDYLGWEYFCGFWDCLTGCLTLSLLYGSEPCLEDCQSPGSLPFPFRALGWSETCCEGLLLRNRLSTGKQTGCYHLWIHWTCALTSLSCRSIALVYQGQVMDMLLQSHYRYNRPTCLSQPAATFWFDLSGSFPWSDLCTICDWTTQSCPSWPFSFASSSGSAWR